MRKDGVQLIAEFVETEIGGFTRTRKWYYRVKGTNGEILFRGPKFHKNRGAAQRACDRHLNLIYDCLNPKNGTVLKYKTIKIKR